MALTFRLWGQSRMTIGELLKALEAYPRGREVILPGANHFHPLHEITDQLYCPHTGEIWNRDDLDEVGQELYQYVVVLWP